MNYIMKINYINYTYVITPSNCVNVDMGKIFESKK